MVKKLCIALSAVCAVLVPFTVVSLWLEFTRAAEVFVAVGGSQAEEQPMREVASLSLEEPPLVPVQWTYGIFYDPSLERIYFQPENGAEDFGEPVLKTNYFYNIHTVTCEGVWWPFDRQYMDGGLIKTVDVYGSKMAVQTRTGCFAELAEDETGRYIQLTDPKTLYDAVVVIDPGHGGYDPGALGANGIYEKDINLSVSSNLISSFKNERIFLLPTRTEDVFISKDDRFTLANMMSDYFISIHSNADEVYESSHGTVTFFNTRKTGGPISGEELALIIQEELVGSLGSRDRGVMEGDIYRVLAEAEVPAVIAEVLFITNPENLETLSRPESRVKIAEALGRAIERLPAPRNTDV